MREAPHNPIMHIGKVPDDEESIGVIDTLSQHADYILDRALSVLTRRYGHEKKIQQILEKIDFDYLESLLKKVMKNSALATGKEFKDFKISEDSVTFNSSMDSLGGATAEGHLMVNAVQFGRVAKEHSFSKENLELAVALVVAHEALHLLARKGSDETGFTQAEVLTSANEAMTEILARAVSDAYNDFTNTSSTKGWLYFSIYQKDVDHLLALMTIIARDNNVEIESVIQAFTASYFCDDSVLDSFSEFAHISKDAEVIVKRLKARNETTESLEIETLETDEETKAFVQAITKERGRNLLVRKALHI